MTTVIIDGRAIDAEKVICPQCETLYLDSSFDTTTDPVVWKATCPKGHTWDLVW